MNKILVSVSLKMLVTDLSSLVLAFEFASRHIAGCLLNEINDHYHVGLLPLDIYIYLTQITSYTRQLALHLEERFKPLHFP